MKRPLAVASLVWFVLSGAAAVAAPVAGPPAAHQPQPPNQTVAPTAPLSSPSADVAAATLNAAQKTIAQVQTRLPSTSNDDQLAQLGAQAAGAQSAAEAIVVARAGDLVRVNDVLKRSARHGRRLASNADSASLITERTSVQSQLRQAQAVAASGSSTFNLVAERRRESFSARVLQRSASPLSPDFWNSLASSSGADFNRLLALARDAAESAFSAPEPFGLLILAFGAAAAAILLIPVRRWLETLAHRRLMHVRSPEGPSARQGLPLSANAVWIAAVDVGLPVLAIVTLHLCAQWGGLLSEKTDALFDAAVVAVTWAAAILTLGRVLATDRETDRRLLKLPDAVAGRVRGSLWAIALITGAGFLITRLNYVIGASVAATIATNCLLSLAYAIAAGLILVGLGRGPADAPEAAAEVNIAPVWSMASLALTIAIAITLGAVLLGYTTLAALVSNQIFWLSVLAAVTYLLLRFTDDLVGALFQPSGWAAHALFVLFRLRRTTLSQLGVLISAALQLIVVIGAVSLALTPFGQSGNLLLARAGQLGQAFHIGSVTISPSAVAAGLATLAIGISIVHVIRNWVVRRYLPVTDWDVGLRNSVSTGVGYLGVGVSVVCALAAMGLGFQQIALIASALSVGIGFGLQQIVQNFVSGVILLIERPVKVGDWVSVDGVEGDVRRIRVRATEIQTFDRSTVIVPNSDLITKSVQNKTLGQPRARIQLQVSIANPADAQKAHDLIISAASGQLDVLQDPAPAVYIDSLASGGGVNFNCYFYVDSPRIVYKTRSDLYFRILKSLGDKEIAFIGAGGPTNVILEPGPMLESLLTTRALSKGTGDRPRPDGAKSAREPSGAPR